MTMAADNSEGVAAQDSAGSRAWVAGPEGRGAEPVSPHPLQFFVLLLLVFLLEVTVTVLFFAYTDKVSPSATSSWGLRRRGAAG